MCTGWAGSLSKEWEEGGQGKGQSWPRDKESQDRAKPEGVWDESLDDDCLGKNQLRKVQKTRLTESDRSPKRESESPRNENLDRDRRRNPWERQVDIQWPKRRGTACQYREARQTLGAGMEAVPGMRLRHLASWAGAAGRGVASSPGEQAGRVRGRWQWQLAGLAMHRMWRMPSACPGTSPSGSKCLVGGQEQAACPGPPPHTCYPEQESGPGMDGQKGPGLHLHFATGYHLPYLGLRERRPQGAYLPRV